MGQEKKENLLPLDSSESHERSSQSEESSASNILETNSIIDLFKFIYEVYELAIPCWKNKLHLHNINKLTQRTLTTFVEEMKVAVDEEDIPERQLVGMANNYFRLIKEIDEFYQEKFTSLKEKTKESYDRLKESYREVSMIILDKLFLPLKIQIKVFFEQQSFFKCKV